MSFNPGTVNLSQTPSRGEGRLEAAGPDPVFGAQRTDGSFGKLAHYKILKQLGCGGMGAVYLAQDEGLERRVALKVMLPGAASDPLAKERFLREARASAAVKHDNVVTIYQVGEDRGIPYIAMEYLAGAPLDQFLARKGRLSVEQTLRVGMEAAEGLAAAHTLGLIHRDIKPANIWLEAPKGRIKILDFGIARRVADQPSMGLTGAGTVVGTPGYMSPEQARGKKLDARSDLFSLGIVLYELTTGQVPFTGDTVLAVLTALAVDDPIPVRLLNPETPPELESLIHRMLAKKPEARPPSGLTVAEELRAIAQGPTVPFATAVEQSAPHVIYVPIAVTVQESFNPSEFDGLGDAKTDEVTQQLTPQPATSGSGMWVAVGGILLLVGLVVAGTIFALQKPTPPVDATVANPAPLTPKPKTIPNPQKDPPKIELPKIEPKPDPTRPPGSLLTYYEFRVLLQKHLVSHLTNQPVTDQELKILQDEKSLGEGPSPCFHTFAVGPIDDKGFEKLSQMPWASKTRNMTIIEPNPMLSLSVADKGFAHVTRFRDIDIISMMGSQITDAGLEPLKTLPKLTQLGFHNSKLTDKAAPLLAELPHLTSLDLRQTDFGDEGVKILVSSPKLTHLYLTGTKVTDAGLDALHGIKLKNLNVQATGVTGAGLKRLKEAMPEITLVPATLP